MQGTVREQHGGYRKILRFCNFAELLAVGKFQSDPSRTQDRAMASPAGSGGGQPSAEDGSNVDQAPAPQGSVTAVQVAVRVRPLVSMETAAGCQECMFGDSENNQVRKAMRRRDIAPWWASCVHFWSACRTFWNCTVFCSLQPESLAQFSRQRCWVLRMATNR